MSADILAPTPAAVNPPTEPLSWYEQMCQRQWQRAAQERQAHEMTHCARCGRTLKDAESIRRGIGPECRRKGAA